VSSRSAEAGARSKSRSRKGGLSPCTASRRRSCPSWASPRARWHLCQFKIPAQPREDTRATPQRGRAGWLATGLSARGSAMRTDRLHRALPVRAVRPRRSGVRCASVSEVVRYPEDAATGIAAAALSFGLLESGLVEAGDRRIRVRQGRAMDGHLKLCCGSGGRWRAGAGLLAWAETFGWKRKRLHRTQLSRIDAAPHSRLRVPVALQIQMAQINQGVRS